MENSCARCRRKPNAATLFGGTGYVRKAATVARCGDVFVANLPREASMRKALYTMLLVAMLGAVGAAPARAQVPVIDTTAVAQLIQQVSQSLQQLQAAQAELQQVQTLVTGVTGARGMDQIAGTLFQPTVRT